MACEHPLFRKLFIQRATGRFIHVLFSSMLICKRVHLRSDSHGPLTLQACLLAHFQTQLAPPAAVRLPQNGAFFSEIENGIVWNGIETGQQRNVKLPIEL